MRDQRMKRHTKIVLSGLVLVGLVAAAGAAAAHFDGWRAKPGGYAGHGGHHGYGMMSEADADGDGAVTRDEMESHHEGLFVRFDRDGDGRVDATEMRAGVLDVRFERLDANGDGVLSREEYAALGAPSGRGAQKRKGASDHGLHGMMRRFDLDDDGAIDREEARRMTRRMFDWMDRNEDGRIEAGERMR